jgi:hypothetical protein
MHENTFYVRYDWSGFTDGGFVSPTWTYTPGGRPHLESLALYGPAKNYCGVWLRYNMPMDIIRWMEKIIHERTPFLPDDPQRLDVRG